MKIEQIVAPVDNFRGDGVSDSLRRRAVFLAGVHAIEILLIERAEINGASQKRWHVRDVDHDHGAGERLRLDLWAQLLQSENGRILVAVNPGDQRQHRAFPGSVEDGDWNGGLAQVDYSGGHLAG